MCAFILYFQRDKRRKSQYSTFQLDRRKDERQNEMPNKHVWHMLYQHYYTPLIV